MHYSFTVHLNDILSVRTSESISVVVN